MTQYIINYSSGETEILPEGIAWDEVVERVLALWDDAWIGHDGDLSEGGDRTLIWRCESDSTDDDGRRSVASITLR